jgi:hypothetical protein
VTGVRDSRYPDPIHFAYETGLFTATLLARWTQDINRSAWYWVSPQWWSSLKYPLIRRLVGKVWRSLMPPASLTVLGQSWKQKQAITKRRLLVTIRHGLNRLLVTIRHGLVLQET